MDIRTTEDGRKNNARTNVGSHLVYDPVPTTGPKDHGVRQGASERTRGSFQPFTHTHLNMIHDGLCYLKREV